MKLEKGSGELTWAAAIVRGGNGYVLVNVRVGRVECAELHHGLPRDHLKDEQNKHDFLAPCSSLV
jgi:hypothetical protein